MRIKKIFFSAIVLILMSGCFVDALKEKRQESFLSDEKQWYVYKFVLKDGREFVPTWQNAKSTMSFDVDEGRIFGVSVCNNYFASFKLKGKKLTISDSGTSRRMCYPDETLSYEFNFTRGLEGEFVVYRKDEQMELRGKDITYYLQLK
ncbi:MAG: META domain-containing protein [Helicobacter sp.]|uniref:META domain-containing protein n=1 Tax=Helicobacter sp. TaxID=218 RepID=UPI0025C0C30E|nr:META domain-containing protein [Helicobacter sp.]MCH5313421.1 META domain-containing protein [Helicobacter sp.]